MWTDDPANLDGPSVWDEQLANNLANARCVIGITYVSEDGTQRQNQMHGVVSSITQELVTFELSGANDGETWTCPPASFAFEKASEGEYRLRTTGEVVTNPDYTVTWTVHEGYDDD